MVTVVNTKPHSSVVKEVVCHNCGATLEYVPRDVKEKVETDYTGGKDLVHYIECPQCSNHVGARKW